MPGEESTASISANEVWNIKTAPFHRSAGRRIEYFPPVCRYDDGIAMVFAYGNQRTTGGGS
jgi:hypothetical protein